MPVLDFSRFQLRFLFFDRPFFRAATVLVVLLIIVKLFLCSCCKFLLVLPRPFLKPLLFEFDLWKILVQTRAGCRFSDERLALTLHEFSVVFLQPLVSLTEFSLHDVR